MIGVAVGTRNYRNYRACISPLLPYTYTGNLFAPRSISNLDASGCSVYSLGQRHLHYFLLGRRTGKCNVGISVRRCSCGVCGARRVPASQGLYLYNVLR
jgi:hypothetical protein